MGPADRRFAIATIRLLLHNTHALIESARTACVRALMVESQIGGVRRAPEQHDQTRYQEYECCSHESHSTEFPGTIAVKTKRPFSGKALFANAVKFLRISQSRTDTGPWLQSCDRRPGLTYARIARKPAPSVNARKKVADNLVEQIGLFQVHGVAGLGKDHEARRRDGIFKK